MEAKPRFEPVYLILPSVASLVVTAISNHDYALVQGCLLSIGLTYVLVNLLTDLVYRPINPWMRRFILRGDDRNSVFASKFSRVQAATDCHFTD